MPLDATSTSFFQCLAVEVMLGLVIASGGEVRACHLWFITSLEMNLWQHGSHVCDMLEIFFILNKIR